MQAGGMERFPDARLRKRFALTYLLAALAFSFFAIVPSLADGRAMTFLVTEVWMLVLAGIVATYGFVLVAFGGDGE